MLLRSLGGFNFWGGVPRFADVNLEGSVHWGDLDPISNQDFLFHPGKGGWPPPGRWVCR